MSVSSSENQRLTVASAFPSTFMWAPRQTIGTQVRTATASPADCLLSRSHPMFIAPVNQHLLILLCSYDFEFLKKHLTYHIGDKIFFFLHLLQFIILTNFVFIHSVKNSISLFKLNKIQNLYNSIAQLQITQNTKQSKVLPSPPKNDMRDSRHIRT